MGSCRDQSRVVLAPDLAHAEFSDACGTQPESLLDITNHDDLRCPICKRNCGRREGAENINDDSHANGAVGTCYQAINLNVQFITSNSISTFTANTGRLITTP